VCASFLIYGRLSLNYTRAVQWETGKVVLKSRVSTDIIVCRVSEGGDFEL